MGVWVSIGAQSPFPFRNAQLSFHPPHLHTELHSSELVFVLPSFLVNYRGRILAWCCHLIFRMCYFAEKNGTKCAVDVQLAIVGNGQLGVTCWQCTGKHLGENAILVLCRLQCGSCSCRKVGAVFFWTWALTADLTFNFKYVFNKGLWGNFLHQLRGCWKSGQTGVVQILSSVTLA